jgi:hypothetical protein
MTTLIIHPHTPKLSEIAAATKFNYFEPHESHPDVKILGLENAATIGIQEIREFIQWVSLRPFQELAKLGILANAHLLTEQAQNALLKTLEEHNPNTTIVLISSNLHALLPTILSRVVKLRLTNTAAQHIDDAAADKSKQYADFLKADYWTRAELLKAYADDVNRVELDKLIKGLLSSLIAAQRNNNNQNVLPLLDSLDILSSSNQSNVNYKLILQCLQILPQLL